MANKEQLIERHRKKLLAKGYPPGIVNLSLQWAIGSAEGMATYAVGIEEADNPGIEKSTLVNQFLPRYLRDTEKWIQAFGHEPKA